MNTAAEGRVRTDFAFNRGKRFAVYARNNNTCVCCGFHDKTGAGEGLSVEHILARSKGGEVQGRLDEGSDNLTTLCQRCNTLKNKYTAKEFNATLKERGIDAHYNVAAIRKVSNRPLTEAQLAEGKKMAEGARVYGLSKGIVVNEAAERYAITPKSVHVAPHAAEEHTGPGVHRDEHGKFSSARLAVIAAARDLVRHLRARLGSAPA